MKMESVSKLPAIQIINWVGVPILVIWIAVKVSVISAILFIILWLVIDKLWDILTDFLLNAVASIDDSKNEKTYMSQSENIPNKMSGMMIIDVLITVAIPWFIAGIFLKWY